MPGLPHDRYPTCLLHRLRQRLRSLDVENDRLALARPRQNIARVDNEEIIAPDYLARVVDDADAVRVAVEGDADVGLILLHGGDEGLDVLWNSRIGVVIRECSVALTEKTTRLDAELWEKLRSNQRPCPIPAVEDYLQISGERTDASGDVGHVPSYDLFFPQGSIATRKLAGDREIMQVLNVA